MGQCGRTSLATHPYHLGCGRPANPAMLPSRSMIWSRSHIISHDGKLIRVHPDKHDPIKAHGAFANHGDEPDRINAAS